MLILSGTIHVDPARVQDFVDAAEGLVSATLASDRGCLEYSVWRSMAGDDGAFHIFEVWQDQECIAEHNASEHYTFFAKQSQDLGVLSAEIKMYDATALK